jgi:hypothetical protein
VDRLSAETAFTAIIGTKLYAVRPPRKVDFPYGTLAIVNQTDTGADYTGKEFRATVELQLFGFPRSDAYKMELAADAADVAFDGFASVTSDGPSKVRVLRRTGRDMLPAWPSTADPDAVQTRQTWDVEIGPGWITRS